MIQRTILWLTLPLLITACQGADTEICRSPVGGRVVLQSHGDSSYCLHHILGADTISSWPLPYPVYRADYGDLTGDGVPEIAVGVIKSTKYWHDVARRLFIFKLYKGELIRPLWLGSRVGFPLRDFRIERDSIPARIITTELPKPDSDSTITVQYRIKGFGIKFDRYIK